MLHVVPPPRDFRIFSEDTPHTVVVQRLNTPPDPGVQCVRAGAMAATTEGSKWDLEKLKNELQKFTEMRYQTSRYKSKYASHTFLPRAEYVPMTTYFLTCAAQAT